MKYYQVTAGDNSTDLGVVGIAPTLLGAKRLGRAAVRNSLPNGQGQYKVRDVDGQEVLIGRRQVGSEWVEYPA